MSYIRCLSNPERLYIWGDVDGTCHIVFKANHYRVNQMDWDKLLRTYNRCWGPTFVGSLRISETPNFKIRLSGTTVDAKKFSITMWEVTWLHIVRNR